MQESDSFIMWCCRLVKLNELCEQVISFKRIEIGEFRGLFVYVCLMILY